MNGLKHGKGTIYDKENREYYIGEFLYGKKYGKGKEFIYDKNYEENSDMSDGNENDENSKYRLIFEGEYINDFKYKGKEYYKNGNLKNEGEYLFKEKWNGKFYDYNGKEIFEIKNGSGLIEEIEKEEKIILYLGKDLNEDKLKEKMQTKEFDYDGNLLFEGEYFLSERYKGKFYEYYDNKLVFEGEYLDGKILNGKGKLYKFGEEFEGDYEIPKKNRDKILFFEGEYLNGVKKGKEYDGCGNLIFEGEYLNDKK